MSFLPLILYMGGKWCITMSFSTIYIYTAELFPTNLRHSLLGICSMTGRMGSILSPQTPLLVSRLPQECTSWRPIRTACWLFAYYFKQYGKDSPICFYIPFIFCVTFFYVALWNRYIDCWLIIIRSGDIIFFIFQSKYYIVHDSVSKNNCYRIVSFFFLIYSHSYFYVTQAQFMPELPLILFGCMALSAGLLSLFFPETLGTKLPDTVWEAENIGKEQQKQELQDLPS